MAKARIIFGVLVLLTVTLLFPVSSSAAQVGTLRCSFIATPTGFNVTWDSHIDNADRYIIERYATRRYWWRGRSDAADGTFQDGPAPSGSASMAYRVQAKDSSGKTMKTADCGYRGSAGFNCSATRQDDGSYSIKWNTRAGGNDTDYVIRRQVHVRGTFYWRHVATGNNTTDSSSPTNEATYRVLARTSGVITAISQCTPTIAPPLTPNTSCVVAGATVTTTLDQIECDAMAALNSIGLGADASVDPCEWTAIRCESSHVVGINVNHVDLNSSLPIELGDLSELQTLEIGGSGLRGPIPPELAGATNLRTINLQANSLTGSIPIELTTLRYLDGLILSDNQLTGEIPAELGAMPRLGVLALDNNQLTGEIPPELGNLVLDGLGLSHNQLTGEIPPELAKIEFIQGMDLQANQLTGTIPPEFSQLNYIQQLRVYDNRLEGDITVAMSGLIDTLRKAALRTAGGHNCFIITDPVIAAEVRRLDARWDTCPPNG